MDIKTARQKIYNFLSTALRQRHQFQNANEDIDAFDLEPIGAENKLAIRVDDYESDCYYTFNAYNLVKFFVMTAKFENPYNRKPFCVLNIRRIYKQYANNTDSDKYLELHSKSPIEKVVLNPSVNFIFMQDRIKNIVRERTEDESIQEFIWNQISETTHECFNYPLRDDVFSSEHCFMLSIMFTQEKSLTFRNYVCQLFASLSQHEIQQKKRELCELISHTRKNIEKLLVLEEGDEEFFVHTNIMIFIQEILRKEISVALLI